MRHQPDNTSGNLDVRSGLVLASARVSGLQPGRAAGQPDRDSLSIDPPRYPMPTGWSDWTGWPVPEPRPASRRRLILRWLASQAARPLAKVVAVGSAAGWVASTAFLAWTLASGHGVFTTRGVQLATAIALPVLDIGAGLVVLRRRSVQSDRPSRATRRRVRRAQAVGRRPGARVFRWWSLQFLLVPSVTESLPRPLRGPLAAGIWITLLAWIGQTVAITLGAFGAGAASVQGQQFAASIWMTHFIVWCCLACRRLGRRRADAHDWL
jgi:hypothetical protein